MSVPAVSVRQVVKTFARAREPVQALRDVFLEIEAGEFFGLLGPNGAGKTTLISCMAGLCRQDAGTIRILGHDTRSDYRAARRSLGVVPQKLVFDPFFSVREILRLQSGYFGVQKNDAWIDELLSELDLSDKADHSMRSLSGGMKRRVLVAQALVHSPPVIILDEPTAGVDVALRQGLWRFIRRLNRDGHTILLTTHYLEEAEALCGRLALLRSGGIYALEKTETLIRQFAKHRLTVHLAEGGCLPPALAAAAKAVPDIERSWEWTLDELSDIESVLAALRESGCRLEDMSISPPDLETAFLKFMGNGPEGTT
ncbi:MAG: Efflux ABC transporter, ATP-binding protein [Fluviibacter phosphoraccumulans EoVTN8]